MKDVEALGGSQQEEGVPLVDSASSPGNKVPVMEMEPPPSEKDGSSTSKSDTTVSSMGLKILVLLAFQNCFKNLLMRAVMKEKPKFLKSAAVINVEIVKLVLCVGYILCVERKSLGSIITFLKEDHRNSLLLAIPAAAYSFQMSMEYVALANLDASIFSVLVQGKLLTTATFSAVLLRKKLKYTQIISLVLLTAGVMLINITNKSSSVEDDASSTKGVLATLGIAISSGFAGVYTEKVIKAQRKSAARQTYGLAYVQVQLALVSLVILGFYAVAEDYNDIVEKGFLYEFTPGAFFTVLNSAIGGLVVAGVLKYADAVLKGYATAISVVLTGVLSMIMFGTTLDALYFLGIVNVVCAVFLYNAKNLDKYACT